MKLSDLFNIAQRISDKYGPIIDRAVSSACDDVQQEFETLGIKWEEEIDEQLGSKKTEEAMMVLSRIESLLSGNVRDSVFSDTGLPLSEIKEKLQEETDLIALAADISRNKISENDRAFIKAIGVGILDIVNGRVVEMKPDHLNDIKHMVSNWGDEIREKLPEEVK